MIDINLPTSWLWDFGDGTTSTQQHPTHTYSKPGEYTVSMTAKNDSGTAVKTKTSFVTVNISGNNSVLSQSD